MFGNSIAHINSEWEYKRRMRIETLECQQFG